MDKLVVGEPDAVLVQEDLELTLSFYEKYDREIKEMREARGKKVRAFWDSRADLGLRAGSQDTILKQLEVEAIAKHVSDGMDVLDIGCGNGITAVEIAGRYKSCVTGVDYSEKMVAAAKQLASIGSLRGTVSFQVGDIRSLPQTLGKFDLIYTERALINLGSWQEQAEAIIGIAALLRDGGRYAMCESSQDGLAALNTARYDLGLAEIAPPWHDCYLSDKKAAELHIDHLSLEAVIDFSSTYYLLSRLVNAYFAKQEGKEPDYNAPVNQLALKLPAIGNMGQTKIWLWHKAA